MWLRDGVYFMVNFCHGVSVTANRSPRVSGKYMLCWQQLQGWTTAFPPERAWQHYRFFAVYYHPRQATSRKLSSQLGVIWQITPKYKKKLKFIDMVKQRAYIRVFKGFEFKKCLYSLLRSLLHCVLPGFLPMVSSIQQIVLGWIFRK